MAREVGATFGGGRMEKKMGVNLVGGKGFSIPRTKVVKYREGRGRVNGGG